MDCPTRADLLLIALGIGGEAGADAIRRHVGDCDSCQRELTQLWDVIDALRSSTSLDMNGSNACLDDDAIAKLIDAAHPAEDRERLAHLATCARCRARLASIARLLRDPAISLEARRLDEAVRARRLHLGPIGAVSTAAAAVLAAILLWPKPATFITREPANEADVLRDSVATTTVAPRILSPVGPAGTEDSLRWTSVAGGDLYRITVWDRDGNVIWEGETRDTALALPMEITRARGVSYLWEIDARIGWDRWVSSALGEFTIRDFPRSR